MRKPKNIKLTILSDAIPNVPPIQISQKTFTFHTLFFWFFTAFLFPFLFGSHPINGQWADLRKVSKFSRIWELVNQPNCIFLRKSSLRSKFLRYQRYKGYRDVRAWILLLLSWFLKPASSALKYCTIRSDSKQRSQLHFLVILIGVFQKKSEKDIRHWLSSCCSAGSQIQPHQLDAVSPWFYHLATNWGISGGYAWNIAQLRELCQFRIFSTSFSSGFGLSIEYRQKKLFVFKNVWKKSLMEIYETRKAV